MTGQVQRLALTPPQLRLWRLEKEDGDVLPVFTITRSIDPREVPSWRTAVEQFVRRHEALRSRVVVDDAGPWLDVDPPDHADAHVQELGTEPDLAIPGPAAQVLVDTSAAEARITIKLHHVLIDLWSWSLLARDFDAFVRGSAAAEICQPSYYARTKMMERYEDNLRVEHERLSRQFTVEESNTTRAFAHDGSCFFDGQFAVVAISDAILDVIQWAKAAVAATDFVVWHAAIGIALSHHLRISNIAAHSVVANRRSPRALTTVGCLSSVSVFDMSLPLDGRVDSYAAKIRSEMFRVTRMSPYDDRRMIELLRDATLPDTYPCAFGTNIIYPLAPPVRGFRRHDSDPVELTTRRSAKELPHSGHFVLTLSTGTDRSGLDAEMVTSSLLPDPNDMLADVISAMRFMTASPRGRISDFRPHGSPDSKRR